MMKQCCRNEVTHKLQSFLSSPISGYQTALIHSLDMEWEENISSLSLHVILEAIQFPARHYLELNMLRNVL